MNLSSLVLFFLLQSPELTKISDSQIAAPQNISGPSVTVLLADGTRRYVVLDTATLVLDQSVTPWKLRALMPLVAPWTDVTLTRGADGSYQLPSTPNGLVIVYRNGVKQTVINDYTRNGRTIVFREVAPDDLITAVYQ